MPPNVGVPPYSPYSRHPEWESRYRQRARIRPGPETSQTTHGISSPSFIDGGHRFAKGSMYACHWGERDAPQ